MARLRKIEIRNFRGIKELSWLPKPGINCLIGPGDSGKSSIIDAIDMCLGARRNVQIGDADFHRLDTGSPIVIKLTIGELDDSLKSMDAYGLYLMSFDPATGAIEDEPKRDFETVLSLQFAVGSDLEPEWTLISDRARAQVRNLAWADRMRLAPARLGSNVDQNLAWRRGSVLNLLSEETPDVSAALLKAARDARSSFGESAGEQLRNTLELVARTATELGVPVGEKAKALLDAHSVSFNGGMISLHGDDGVPLRSLGTGSSRLLVAGLQRAASETSSIVLADEVEHGLEPHRIIRLLGSLGAKENSPPLQVFLTTHSPAVLRELRGGQLFVVRTGATSHAVSEVGEDDDVQSTIRLFPEAFLAPSIVVCEGASEVGLVKGLDYYRSAQGDTSISACGVALVDAGGGEADRIYKRARAFRGLGYRTAVLRDDDKKPSEVVEQDFIASGGAVIRWRDGRALEDELFRSLATASITELLNYAVELHGEQLINDHIKSASTNTADLSSIRAELMLGPISDASREILGRSARARRAGWYKSVTWMEAASRNIVGPGLQQSDKGFRESLQSIFDWSLGACT